MFKICLPDLVILNVKNDLIFSRTEASFIMMQWQPFICKFTCIEAKVKTPQSSKYRRFIMVYKEWYAQLKFIHSSLNSIKIKIEK